MADLVRLKSQATNALQTARCEAKGVPVASALLEEAEVAKRQADADLTVRGWAVRARDGYEKVLRKARVINVLATFRPVRPRGEGRVKLIRKLLARRKPWRLKYAIWAAERAWQDAQELLTKRPEFQNRLAEVTALRESAQEDVHEEEYWQADSKYRLIAAKCRTISERSRPDCPSVADLVRLKGQAAKALAAARSQARSIQTPSIVLEEAEAARCLADSYVAAGVHQREARQSYEKVLRKAGVIAILADIRSATLGPETLGKQVPSRLRLAIRDAEEAWQEVRSDAEEEIKVANHVADVWPLRESAQEHLKEGEYAEAEWEYGEIATLCRTSPGRHLIERALYNKQVYLSEGVTKACLVHLVSEATNALKIARLQATRILAASALMEEAETAKSLGDSYVAASSYRYAWLSYKKALCKAGMIDMMAGLGAVVTGQLGVRLRQAPVSLRDAICDAEKAWQDVGRSPGIAWEICHGPLYLRALAEEDLQAKEYGIAERRYQIVAAACRRILQRARGAPTARSTVSSPAAATATASPPADLLALRTRVEQRWKKQYGIAVGPAFAQDKAMKRQADESLAKKEYEEAWVGYELLAASLERSSREFVIETVIAQDVPTAKLVAVKTLVAMRMSTLSAQAKRSGGAAALLKQARVLKDEGDRALAEGDHRKAKDRYLTALKRLTQRELVADKSAPRAHQGRGSAEGRRGGKDVYP